MATYFHGSSEIQAGGLQTLYLMNPNYVGFSDTQQQQPPQPNILFFNSAAGNNATISHAPPPQNHHFFGIPLPTVRSAGSEDPNRPSDHEIPVLHGMVPRFHYNLGNPPHIHTAAATASSGGAVDVPLQFGFRSLVVSPTTQQGLSLSLSSQNPAYNPSLAAEHEISGQAPVTVISPARGNDMRGSGGSSSSASNGNGVSGIQNVILGSKYLKTAQQLLDEVVNVGKALQTHTGEGTKEKAKLMNRESMAETGDGPTTGEASSDCGAELTTAQKQELQMKKAKLLSMLDEVEQRYRQYHHQMEIVVSLFEQASGIGSAKSYTTLALQTISKQFRCLKEAIATQIKATSKGLGEDDSLGGKGEGSRLKFDDHQLRQQLGMIQQNAWRPQRGLPERAVSVLRAWLFEHFLHPYPKDSDKYMLAKQTGLTRSQVSNWFINARVRLWKPMVEEMYTEEMKDQEQNGSENNMSRSEPSKDSGSKSTAPQESKTFQMDQTYNLQSKQEKQINQTASPTEIPNSTASTSPLRGSLQPLAGFTLIGSSEMEGIVQRSPKKPRSSDLQNSPSSILSMDMDMKHGATNKGINEIFGTERQTHESYSLIAANASHGSGFGTYPIGDIGRFHGNSVSLTLSLPHCENLSLSGAQQSYLSNQNIQLGSRLDMGAVENRYSAINAPQPSHSNTDYENIDIQNRKRFAAQLLPDFVA